MPKERLTLTKEENQRVERMAYAIGECVSGASNRVIGPAFLVVLTELAKTEAIPLEVLLHMVREQYSQATGDLFAASRTD